MSIAQANRLIRELKFEQAKILLQELEVTYRGTPLEKIIGEQQLYCKRQLSALGGGRSAMVTTNSITSNRSPSVEGANHGCDVKTRLSLKHRKGAWTKNARLIVVSSSSCDRELVALAEQVQAITPNSLLATVSKDGIAYASSGKVVPADELSRVRRVLSTGLLKLPADLSHAEHLRLEMHKATQSAGNPLKSVRIVLPESSHEVNVASQGDPEAVYLVIRQIAGVVAKRVTGASLPTRAPTIQRVGLLFHSLETGGLYRDAVVLAKILNADGVVPEAFLYCNWRELNSGGDKSAPVHSPTLHDFKANFHSSWKKFIDEIDVLVVSELLLPKLFVELLRKGKKVVLLPNIESTVESETLDIDETYKILRDLSRKSGFTLLSKNISTREFYAARGIRTEYTPFSIDWVYKPRPIALSKDKWRFLCNVGNTGVDDRKNVRAVIEAFQIARQTQKNIELVLKSTVDLRERMSVNELENVTLINGKCTDDELAQLYDDADCIIYASKYDGLGLGVLEAQAKDLPIILSDIEPFREMLCENSKAFFVEGDITRYWRNVPVFEISVNALAREIEEFVTKKHKNTNSVRQASYLKLRNVIFERDILRLVYGDRGRSGFRCEASIAHFPERRELFLDILPDIIRQFDKINIGLNEYESLSGYQRILANASDIHMVWLDDDYKALTKFMVSGSLDVDYCFTLDDDIFLPEDYVSERIKLMQKYGDSVLISSCGKRFKDLPQNRNETVASLRFRDARSSDTAVDNLGTGLMSWHPNTFAPTDFVEYVVSKGYHQLARVSVDDALTSYIAETGTAAVVEGLSSATRFILHTGMKRGLHEHKVNNVELDKNITIAMLQFEFDKRRKKVFAAVRALQSVLV